MIETPSPMDTYRHASALRKRASRHVTPVTCPHPERAHSARGLCSSCYSLWYHSVGQWEGQPPDTGVVTWHDATYPIQDTATTISTLLNQTPPTTVNGSTTLAGQLRAQIRRLVPTLPLRVMRLEELVACAEAVLRARRRPRLIG